MRFAFSTEYFVEFRRFLSRNNDEGLSDSSTSLSAGSGGNINGIKMRGNDTGGLGVQLLVGRGAGGGEDHVCLCEEEWIEWLVVCGRSGLLRSVSLIVKESVREVIKKVVEFLEGTGSWRRDGHHQGDALSSSRNMASCRCCRGQLGKSNNDALLDDI